MKSIRSILTFVFCYGRSSLTKSQMVSKLDKLKMDICTFSYYFKFNHSFNTGLITQTELKEQKLNLNFATLMAVTLSKPLSDHYEFKDITGKIKFLELLGFPCYPCDENAVNLAFADFIRTFERAWPECIYLFSPRESEAFGGTLTLSSVSRKIATVINKL